MGRMSQGMHLSQRMALQQVLAPQLQHSLALLQAPVMELRALVEQEMAQNPVIEETEPEDPEARESAEDPITGDPDRSEDSPTAEQPSEPTDDFKEEFDRLARLDEEWRDSFAQTNQSLRSREDQDERRQFMLDSLVAQTSLQEHLLDQVRMSDFSPEQRQVAEMIVGNIDDHGYLQASVDELVLSTGHDPEPIEAVLKIVQGFHPVGVAARNLRECLMLQLERAGLTGTLEYRIIRDHMDILARRRLPELARAVIRPVSDVQSAVERIAHLEPRPGRDFGTGGQTYVTPELTIEKAEAGWQVVMHDESVPRLRISNTYKDLMAQADSSAEVRDYIRDKIRAGRFLIKSINQRQETIRKIAWEIVQRQGDFLERGMGHLRPMTMAQIASAVGVHETTVSRAVSAKYVQTPQGVFEMKSFFTSGLETANGEHLSNRSVKDMLATMVAQEDPHKPLSDETIEKALKEKGIKIARRTVAKYRMELNILPSHLRRTY